MNDIPKDFGAHHRLSSSGLVHASNTMRAGPLKVRVTISSRSDFRSIVVRFVMGEGSISFSRVHRSVPSLDNLVPITAAIWRSLNRASVMRRRTSRILRTDNFCCATVDLPRIAPK
jgi:hypothetical protein